MARKKNYDIGTFVILTLFVGVALLILINTVNPWYILGPILAVILLKIWKAGR